MLRVVLVAVLATVLCAASTALGQTPQTSQQSAVLQEMADMSAMISAFKRDPESERAGALQRQIIARKRTMISAMGIPDRARRALLDGVAALQAGQSAADEEQARAGYVRARALINEAMCLVPWWGETLLQRAAVRERQGDLAGAIGDLELYLATGPAEKDGSEARDRIAALSARKG